jgi:hypothetical protein
MAAAETDVRQQLVVSLQENKKAIEQKQKVRQIFARLLLCGPQ